MRDLMMTVAYISMLVLITLAGIKLHEYNNEHGISNCVHYLDNTSSDCTEGE
jgi:hypothetical protein